MIEEVAASPAPLGQRHLGDADAVPYAVSMVEITLPPNLERFATEALAAGRYRDSAELITAGVDLLRQHEEARTAFIETLDDAFADAEREGWRGADDVVARLYQLIEAKERDAA